MIVFLLTAISIWAGMHFYVGVRLVGAAGLSPGWTRAGWGAVIALMFLGPTFIWLHEAKGEGPWLRAAEWCAFMGFGISSLLAGILLIRDLAWIAALGLDWLGGLKTGRALLPPGATRQAVENWSSIGVVAAALAIAAAGLVETRRPPRIEETTVRVPDLAPALKGFRIVVISDLHLGRTTPPGFMESVAEAVNGLRPDIVVFPGDFGDAKANVERENALRLKEVTARYGKFFVTGNHEYYSDFPRWIEMAREAGFTVLMSENRTVQVGRAKLLVAGIPDHEARETRHERLPSLAELAPGLDSVEFAILLAHQPRRAKEAAEAGFNLMISGHTHGGQYFPYTWIVKLFYRWDRGMFAVGGMALYVSRGTGYWGPPIRAGSPSEISLLVLQGHV